MKKVFISALLFLKLICLALLFPVQQMQTLFLLVILQDWCKNKSLFTKWEKSVYSMQWKSYLMSQRHSMKITFTFLLLKNQIQNFFSLQVCKICSTLRSVFITPSTASFSFPCFLRLNPHPYPLPFINWVPIIRRTHWHIIKHWKWSC